MIGNEFRIVSPATENARVPRVLLWTRGSDRWWHPADVGDQELWRLLCSSRRGIKSCICDCLLNRSTWSYIFCRHKSPVRVCLECQWSFRVTRQQLIRTSMNKCGIACHASSLRYLRLTLQLRTMRRIGLSYYWHTIIIITWKSKKQNKWLICFPFTCLFHPAITGQLSLASLQGR